MSTKIIKIKKAKKQDVVPNIKTNNLNKKPMLEEDVEIAYKPIADISNKISNFINKNE